MIRLELQLENKTYPMVIQCDSYDVDQGGMTFHAMRIIGLGYDPNEYWASFFIPNWRIVYMRRAYEPGQKRPSYGSSYDRYANGATKTKESY